MTSIATVCGHWSATIATPIGKHAVDFEILPDRTGGIRGMATDKHGSVEMRALVLDDNRLSWSQDVTRPLRLTLLFDVVIEGNSMHGIAKAGALPSSKVSAVRDGDAR